jgi:hypothetical protein
MISIEKEKARLEAVSDIVTVQDAMDKLIARKYAIPDQEYSNDFLATILTQITLILPAEAASIVKAVAILLSELELDMCAEHAADALMDSLKEPFSQFIDMATIAKAQAEKIADGHDSIENRILDIIRCIDDIHAVVIQAQDHSCADMVAAENTHNALQSHIESLASTTPGLPCHPPPDPTSDSYASHVRAPPMHDRVMVRNDEKSR